MNGILKKFIVANVGVAAFALSGGNPIVGLVVSTVASKALNSADGSSHHDTPDTDTHQHDFLHFGGSGDDTFNFLN